MMPSTCRSSRARTSRCSRSASVPEFISSSSEPYSAAARCAPTIVIPAWGDVAIRSLTKPMVSDRCSRRPCANRFGRYPRSSAAALTRIRVLSGMRLPGTSFSTWETVVVEKPARSATSRIVTLVCTIAFAQSVWHH